MSILQGIVPLPVKNGVSPNCLWLPKGNWSNVLEFFLEKFPHLEKKECIRRFERHEVVKSNGEILNVTSKYQSGQHIYFYRELESEIIIPFSEKIIYQNENIIVADKPHFLPVSPTGQYLHETLLVRLRKKFNIDTLELCHRLDRETAGVVLLTKKKQVRQQYHALFAERKITKIYHALAPAKDYDFPIIRKSRLVKGEPYFRMKEQSGQSNSETHIKQLENRSLNSLYELRPITGKKHQLRVHMAAMDMAIVNDPLYPNLTGKLPQDLSNPLQLLAKSIKFIDPISGVPFFFESKQGL